MSSFIAFPLSCSTRALFLRLPAFKWKRKYRIFHVRVSASCTHAEVIYIDDMQQWFINLYISFDVLFICNIYIASSKIILVLKIFIAVPGRYISGRPFTWRSFIQMLHFRIFFFFFNLKAKDYVKFFFF